MTTETADLNRRVRDLGTTIKELVTPMAPKLMEITGIGYITGLERQPNGRCR